MMHNHRDVAVGQRGQLRQPSRFCGRVVIVPILVHITAMALPLTLILDVRFYATKTGAEPARDWLRSLPQHIRKIIGDDIKTVQLGWPIGMPLVRDLEPGSWEVRIRLPDGIARVVFTTNGPVTVLVHGFIKKMQQTPKQDLELARKRMKEVRHG